MYAAPFVLDETKWALIIGLHSYYSTGTGRLTLYAANTNARTFDYQVCVIQYLSEASTIC